MPRRLQDSQAPTVWAVGEKGGWKWYIIMGSSISRGLIGLLGNMRTIYSTGGKEPLKDLEQRNDTVRFAF